MNHRYEPADQPPSTGASAAPRPEPPIEDTWSEQAAQPPSTPEEVAAEAAMRDAEVAVVEHTATDEQRRRVAAMSKVRSRSDRRDVWSSFDEPTG